MSSDKKDLGGEIYSGLSSFGRIYALIGAIIATCVAITMIVAGIYFLVHKDTNVQGSGKVTAINESPTGICDPSIVNNNLNYNCNVSFEYTYNSTKYTADLYISSSTKYYIGQTVSIWIDPSNPGLITVQRPTPKYVGGFLIGGGIFLALISWFWFWAARKYKIVGAVAGAQGAVGILGLFGGNRG